MRVVIKLSIIAATTPNKGSLWSFLGALSIFFGIFLTAALAAFIIRRHASVMKRHQDTAVAVVLDLNSLPEEEKQRILRGEDVEDPCALSWERRRAVDGVSAATFSGPSKPSLEKLPLLSVNNSSPPNPNNNSLH